MISSPYWAVSAP